MHIKEVEEHNDPIYAICVCGSNIVVITFKKNLGKSNLTTQNLTERYKHNTITDKKTQMLLYIANCLWFAISVFYIWTHTQQRHVLYR